MGSLDTGTVEFPGLDSGSKIAIRCVPETTSLLFGRGRTGRGGSHRTKGLSLDSNFSRGRKVGLKLGGKNVRDQKGNIGVPKKRYP